MAKFLDIKMLFPAVNAGVILLISASVMNAGLVTYNYTGNHFSSFTPGAIQNVPPATASDFLTASITLPELPPNLVLADEADSLQSWSVTAGVHCYSGTGSPHDIRFGGVCFLTQLLLS